ncbi:MAG: molecular chaperone DnaK [SAR86 cluster bacterium]|uniref:Molecular chaperone DnaK n=1 Tax=SAR86 cluster bacterium TaxID=2030880 RepID=A0A2A4WZ32_9GAMM|nr:MAG: molecular chaperone DnaK [SAR86 cluster bacterium]
MEAATILDQLTPKQTEELRSLLQFNKNKLEQQLLDAESATGVVTLDQSSVGRVSRMDAMQQQSMAVSTRTKAEASLRKILKALKRMDLEDFGYCGQCDEPIPFNRLKVQPEASHCLKCQDQQESL